MPNRMLRDWTDSLKFDGISADAERLFVRLIMKADDYGRFHADPRLLKANCFPLIETLRPNDLIRWLDELSSRQLILRYETDGRSLLAIVNYGQRLKSSRAKFPPIAGRESDWLPVSGDFRELPGSSRNFPLEEKRSRREVEDEVEEKPNTPLPPEGDGEGRRHAGVRRPSLDQAKAAASMIGVTPEMADEWWHAREASEWMKGAGGGGTTPVGSNWQADLKTYASRMGSNGKTAPQVKKLEKLEWEK